MVVRYERILLTDVHMLFGSLKVAKPTLRKIILLASIAYACRAGLEIRLLFLLSKRLLRDSQRVVVCSYNVLVINLNLI